MVCLFPWVLWGRVVWCVCFCGCCWGGVCGVLFRGCGGGGVYGVFVSVGVVGEECVVCLFPWVWWGRGVWCVCFRGCGVLNVFASVF